MLLVTKSAILHSAGATATGSASSTFIGDAMLESPFSYLSISDGME